MQSRLKGAAAPIALIAMLAASPVQAQDAGEAEQPDAAADEASEASDDGTQGQPIVVTGSRIRRDEFTAPSPITVIDPEIAVRQGLMDTSEMIQGSPIASGSSQVTGALSSQFAVNGGQGVQTISLRGLGAERTLVLLNSRRAGPAGTRGGVSAFDLNVLPQSIVERVDILKDGASSIYGSDAVAGVVNLMTRTDLDGFELDVFGSVPQKRGGEVFSGSASWGKTFDKGHVLVSGNYYRQEPLQRGDRSYLQCEEAYVFTNSTLKRRADHIDPRTGKYSCSGDESNTVWGHVWTYDYSYLDTDGDGLANSGSPFGTNVPTSTGNGEVFLVQPDYGDNLGRWLPAVPRPRGPGQIGIPDGFYPVSYDYASEPLTNNYHPNMDTNAVIPKTDRYTLYLDASYEIAPNIEAYAELLYNKRKTYYESSFQVYMFGYGERYEYYYDYDGDGLQETDPLTVIPGDPFAPGWTGAAVFSPTTYNDHWDSWQEVDYYRGVAGFRGDISSSWSYDLYGQYSRSDGDYGNERVLKDAVSTQEFRFGSCVGEVTPISRRECVDVDWYSPRVLYGDFNAEEAGFLFDTEVGNTLYTQWYVEGVVTGDTGDWFELPGGAVGLALGGTYREDAIDDVPGEITRAGNAWEASTSGITKGQTGTIEGFGEINLPLLRDLPLIQSLTLTGAARITNVKATRASDGATDSTNGNWTYKLGADWEVTDWLRLRGTYGTSFRAPALFEQFLADEKSALSQRAVDPCIQWGINLAQGNITQRMADNCAADGVPINHTGAGIGVNVYTGGGFGLLEPETSKAWTASAILTPKFDFLPHTDVSLAVDYFDIEVNGEIANLGSANIVFECYSSDFFPNDPLCDLFARVGDLQPGDPDYNSGTPANIARVHDSFLNVNSQKNRGIDVTARAQHDFAGDWTLTFQAQMTWQLEDNIALFEGLVEDNNGEAGDPVWVGDFRLMLDHGPWSFFYGLDVVGATSNEEDWIDANGSLCNSFVNFDNPATPEQDLVCQDLKLPAMFYHSISGTREIGDRYEITVGIANLFDTHPPRSSSINDNGINNFGRGVLYSQYDLLGRRFFANVKARF